MKKLHTVKHDGHEFTRTSASRTYTHAVLGISDVADVRVDAFNRANKAWDVNLNYHECTARGERTVEWDVGLAERHPVKPEEKTEAQAILDAGKDAYVAKIMAAHDLYSSQRPTSSDGKSFYFIAGWCGRVALAEKLAHTTRGARLVYRALVLSVVSD